MYAWKHNVPQILKIEFKKRLQKISLFQKFDNLQKKKMCALFTIEQIKQVNMIDVEYGYNFKDENMLDCFEALNALPRRESRKLV